jgi:hypothetical protein
MRLEEVGVMLSDPDVAWGLEFVVSNITGNNYWTKLYFGGF